MDTADAVVIGGGIVGLSIAYHLAEKGANHVVVVERRQMLGSGTTSKSGGGLRKQFSLPVNIRLAKYSQDFYARLDDAFEHSLDLRRHGYLLLAACEAHRTILLRNIQTQREQGVTDVVYVEADDIRLIAPDLRVEDIVGAAYCPSDGYLSPDGAAYAIAKQSRMLGVSFLTGEEVLRIGSERDQVSEVSTNMRTLSTRIIVNAAGPHAGEIARMVGVDLPIQPLRRNLFLLGPVARPAIRYPVVLDLQGGFSARHEPEGILIGGGDRNEPPHLHFSAAPDMDYFARICPQLIKRIPALEAAGLLRASAGTDGYTPDGNAIVGAMESVSGFYGAAGFCGHGVMQAPAVGKALSELIIDGYASTDIGGLSLARFNSPSRLPSEGMVMAHHDD
jgi:sarcosine oxidase subunit beta